jgi:hypothetical protein
LGFPEKVRIEPFRSDQLFELLDPRVAGQFEIVLGEMNLLKQLS